MRSLSLIAFCAWSLSISNVLMTKFHELIRLNCFVGLNPNISKINALFVQLVDKKLHKNCTKGRKWQFFLRFGMFWVEKVMIRRNKLQNGGSTHPMTPSTHPMTPSHRMSDLYGFGFSDCCRGAKSCASTSEKHYSTMIFFVIRL